MTQRKITIRDQRLNILSTLLITCLLLPAGLSAANVIGYFTSWGIYGDNPYTPVDIPYEKLTHIQYAFFLPEQDGAIVSSDEWADELNLKRSNSLVERAHNHNVKVLPSVGGWTGSANFPALAASAQTRSRFCGSARALIEEYNFDGIDIDWEYPGFVDHNGTPQDAQNFVLLLSELRDTLDAMAGERKLITLAVAGSSYHGDSFLIEDFIDDVDFVSIMTYDYTGVGYPSTSWHNSPLYDYDSEDYWSVDRAMSYYTRRGIPPSKLNIGMAFYGRSFADCEGVGSAYSGAGTGQPGEPGMIHYATIDEMIAQGIYTRYWDTLAAVPYCLTGDGEYCSYDDTTSIRMKAQYCNQNGYGGAIIWELKAGRTGDGSQPLLDAAAKVLIEPTRVAGAKTAAAVVGPRVSKRGANVAFTLRSPSGVSLRVYDLQGRLVMDLGVRSFDRGTHTIGLQNAVHKPAKGSYIMEIRSLEWNRRMKMPTM